MDEPQHDVKPAKGELVKMRKLSALAFQLPITIVAAVLVGGGLGYLLDHWLHTKWVFTLIFGGLGFAAGVREVIRQLP